MLPESSVSGQPEVPAGSEAQDGVRRPAAAPDGSLLRGRALGTALHHRAQDEEHEHDQE